MDQAALEYTRSHYDKHSNQVRACGHAMASPALPPPRLQHACIAATAAAITPSPAASPLLQYVSTEDALRARAAGPGAPLKRFHNDIKRKLISRFARDAGCLLDLACGRGGDIWKWIDAGARLSQQHGSLCMRLCLCLCMGSGGAGPRSLPAR